MRATGTENRSHGGGSRRQSAETIRSPLTRRLHLQLVFHIVDSRRMPNSRSDGVLLLVVLHGALQGDFAIGNIDIYYR